MSVSEDEFRDLQVELMIAQRDLARRQDRWEVAKALAAMLAASAVMAGAIIGLANYWHPGGQTTVIQLPPGASLSVTPAKPEPAK